MAPGTLPSPATGPSVRDVRAQISAERARTGGAPIDMQPADDGTFVAAERSSGQRAATLGRTADGRTVYSGDHNAVDAPVTPIAALPERAETLDEFVPTPGGRVARKRDVTDLRPLVDEAGQPIDDFGADLAQLRATPVHPGKPAREPMTRPAAVADREFDGAAVTRTIYSSDPAAVDAPLIALEDPDRHELRRMLAEMDSLPFTPRTFNEPGIGQGGAPAVVGGAGGARVYDDVTKGYASSRPSRAEVAQGIREALDETPTALAQRALAVARGRQRGDPAVSRPQLPDEAGDLAQSGRMTDTDAREFDRFVARLAGDGTDDLGFLGEAGAVSPALLQHLGGAAAGATAGVASTDEHDSTARQVLRGVVGGALGAAAPALLRSGRPGGSTAARLTDHAPAAPGARATGTDQPAVEPFATASREPATPKHGRTDPLKGVDTFIEKFPEELRVGVREVIERHGGFDAQRRGVIRAEDTARLAEHIRVEASRRLKPGTALNAEGIRRFTDGIASAQAKVNQFAGKVARGDATDADVLALEAARAEVGTLAASVMGARSEAGRALAEFKVLARVLQTGNPKLVREAVEGLRGDAAAFAEAFGQQPPDPVARYRWLQQQRQGGLGEKVRSYYYANILSGLKTHERNVIGNAANVLSNVVVQPFQAGADAVRSAVTGAPRTVRLSELPSQVAGAVVGIPRGFAEALFSARYGVNRSALTQAMSAAEAGKLDVPRVEFAGGGANPFNWPGRALDSADQFFRTIAKSMELSGLAHAQATREGLTGQKLQNRMAALMAGGDPLSAQLEQQADAFARRGVFQEKPDRFASSLQVFSKQHPSFAFVVPFIKTPANILRQGLEFSPAGALMKEARKEGRAGSQAQGRAALGSLAAGYLAYLASTGRLSGSGPSDATERAQLMESGWRPNSVKVGDAWVSYSLFQPVSVQAAVIANAEIGRASCRERV